MKPGARLDAFRLRLDGPSRVSINQNGEAEIALETGTLVQRAPVMYQDIDGVRKPVRGGYVLLDPHTLGFLAEPYDAAHTLVVDPILTYGSYIGGTGDETIEAATTGPDGSLYLTGYTTSPALFGQRSLGIGPTSSSSSFCRAAAPSTSSPISAAATTITASDHDRSRRAESSSAARPSPLIFP